ncbi:hypothetical protein BC629DRAFT_1298088 [Irpex lacteus]|nr:hypothetical protein BC629DRAFT_1298088 [Irpex lacteus]
MLRYPCKGWLHVTVDSRTTLATIKIKHEAHHQAYLDIDLPEQWCKYIKDHARTETLGQIWRHIVAEEFRGKSAKDIDISFRRHAVAYYWETVSQTEWKLDPNPIESAQKWIVERGDSHQVAILDVEAAPGTRAVAFQVTDFMEEWAKNTRELAVDSTCK